MAHYFTINKPGNSDYRDRGSKFLGRSFRVENKVEVEEYLKAIKKEFYDARHHCYAYCVGKDAEIQFASDDGEPGHSAGDPILGQIRRRSLTNTLVIVIRYFGGTKLGVPGLINAYKTAADECLEQSGISKIEIRFNLIISFPYESTPVMERFVSQHNLKFTDKEYTEFCKIRASAPVDDQEKILDNLETLFQRSLILEYKSTED